MNIKRIGTMAVAALVATVGIQAAAAAPVQAFSSSGAGTTQAVTQNIAPYAVATSASHAEAMVLSQINGYRAENGLGAISQDNGFTKGAREWAQHLSDTGKAPSHPDGGYFFENVAYAISPERAVGLWKNSDGHNRNMLNAEITHGGVGIVERGNGTFAVVFRGMCEPSGAGNSKGHPAW